MANEEYTEEAPLSGFEGRGGKLRIGSVEYAVGLVWRSFDDTLGKKIAAQAKDLAAERGADLYGLRQGIQFCLGSTSYQHKAGMPSLAATLVTNIQGSFVGAFEVDGGVYIVAVQQDGVMATEDVVYPDADQAISHFQDLSTGGWDQKFCPASWQIPETSPTTLEILLSGSQKAAKLRPVSHKKRIIQIAVLAALAMGGLFAYNWYEEYKAEQIAQEEMETRAAEAAAMRRRQEEAARAVPDFVWNGQAVGQYALDSCVNAILEAPTEIPGWTPTSLVCEGGTVSMTLLRSGGTINAVGFTLIRDGFRPSIRPVSQANVIVAWPVPSYGDLPKLANDSPTGQVAAAGRYVLTQAEELPGTAPGSFLAVTQTPVQGPTVQLPDPSNPNRTVPVVMSQSLDIGFTTRHDPREFLPFLAPLQAMTLTRVSLTAGDFVWKVEGQIHERLFNAAAPRNGAPPARGPGNPPR